MPDGSGARPEEAFTRMNEPNVGALGSVGARTNMYCQVCGAMNPDEREYCVRCHQKLLVLSGTVFEEEEEGYEEGPDEGFSFDEHLLERISILEEAVKRTAETVRQLLSALHKQEKNILISQTGLSTLREILEQKKIVGWDEWSELWESKMDYQLLALEKRERFVSIKERIAALHSGDKRKVFLQHLDDAEYALFGFDIERAVGALEAAYKLDRDNYELAYFLGSQMEVGAGAGLSGPRRQRAERLVRTLTPRQLQVLEHMIAGYRNKQIAGFLAIDEKTVKMHRAGLLARLGVGSSAEAVRIGVEAGLQPGR